MGRNRVTHEQIGILAKLGYRVEDLPLDLTSEDAIRLIEEAHEKKLPPSKGKRGLSSAMLILSIICYELEMNALHSHFGSPRLSGPPLLVGIAVLVIIHFAVKAIAFKKRSRTYIVSHCAAFCLFVPFLVSSLISMIFAVAFPEVAAEHFKIERQAAESYAIPPKPMMPPGTPSSAIMEPEPLEGIDYGITIAGVIGEDFTAREFRSRLSIADRFTKKANVIFLFIDSPGGSVSDLEEIIRIIQATTNKRFIAVVTKALSAAAIIAIACDTIYIESSARIGAATPYMLDKNGGVVKLPPAIEEKQFSAMRALVRIAARQGGHSTLLAEAMVDPGIQVRMTKKRGVTVLQRDGNGDIISRKNEVLTLTGEEAITCGLARDFRKFWPEYGKALSAQKLTSLSKVANDPLENFANSLIHQYVSAKIDKKLSENEAKKKARTWAQVNHANASWLHRPLPIVLRSITRPSGEQHYYIDGETLLGTASVFGWLRERPSFISSLQKGDVVMISGDLDFEYINMGGVRAILNFNDCQCTQSR
jgi:hypothetical protein